MGSFMVDIVVVSIFIECFVKEYFFWFCVFVNFVIFGFGLFEVYKIGNWVFGKMYEKGINVVIMVICGNVMGSIVMVLGVMLGGNFLCE